MKLRQNVSFLKYETREISELKRERLIILCKVFISLFNGHNISFGK